MCRSNALPSALGECFQRPHAHQVSAEADQGRGAAIDVGDFPVAADKEHIIRRALQHLFQLCACGGVRISLAHLGRHVAGRRQQPDGLPFGTQNGGDDRVPPFALTLRVACKRGQLRPLSAEGSFHDGAHTGPFRLRPYLHPWCWVQLLGVAQFHGDAGGLIHKDDAAIQIDHLNATGRCGQYLPRDRLAVLQFCRRALQIQQGQHPS